MRLAAGTRVGPYEIISSIGAGGMGEVYRARDSRLDRDVAVKILPEHLALDSAARARFEREAKAIATLSDPHILAIYDFGVDKDIAYVVTELLEGETLRSRLAHGSVPSKKAIQVATEIALGLAAAHDKGIVHRDIKPENVFIAANGHVKILDFGLARQTEDGAFRGDKATELRATDPGTVLGTVGYMSPEQVRGENAGHRSDIFSIGCVLYELLTGRRAFDRGTAAETMTAILREEPPDPTQGARAIPPALDQMVKHCLEKRPEERFQSARDLAFALQSVSGGSTASGSAAPAISRRPARYRGTAVAAGGAVAALAIGIAAGRYVWTEAPPESKPLSFEQVTEMPGIQTTPSLSPDGKTVVYAQVTDGASHLFLQHVGSRAPVALAPRSTSDDSQPAFSPDGERIAFRSERDGGGIFVMTSAGESVKRVTNGGFNPSWSADGKEIAFSAGRFEAPGDLGTPATGLSAVNVATGQKRQVIDDAVVLQPSWSPHGTRIAYWGLRGDTGQRDIWTVAADGTSGPVSVTEDEALDWSPAWSADGRFLYFSSLRGGTMNVWRIAIDEASGHTRGAPEPVTTPSNWSGFIALSRDGSRMAFASLNWRSTLFKAPFDPVRGVTTGPPMTVLRNARAIRDHDVSPDQQWIAFMETGAKENVVIARADGSEYRLLTDDAFRNRGPVWSFDGQRIAFYSDRDGPYNVWTIRADGSGLAKVTDLLHANYPVWSPDGTRLVVSLSTSRTPWWQIVDLKQAPMTMARPSLPQPPAGAHFRPMSWSFDGRLVLGSVVGSDGSNTDVGIYDVSSHQYTMLPEREAIPVTVAWLPDGRQFLMRDARGIWLRDSSSGARKLLISVGGYMNGRSVSVTRDAKWITYTETGTEGEIWLALLKK